MYAIIKKLKIEEILNFSNKIAGLSTKYIGVSSFLDKTKISELLYKI